MKWFKDKINKNECHLFGIKKTLVSERSKFQQIQIIDTYEHGKCLILDGHIQVSEKDEYIYHELLVHPALITHPDPKKVLIIGGGDGFILKEVLRHNCVEDVEIVDMDRRVVELSNRYLTKFNNGCFFDGRVSVKYCEGRKYIEGNPKKFDVIIIDLSEPVKKGTSELLFTKEFYGLIKERLNKGGMIALHTTSPFFHYKKIHVAIYKTLCYIFPIVKFYYGYIPSFDMLWGFGIASKRYNPEKISLGNINKRITERNVKSLKYYDSRLHKGLFILPKDLKEAIKVGKTIISDKKPLFVQ